MVLGESIPDIIRGGPTCEAQIHDNVELQKATINYCNANPHKFSVVAAAEERTVVGSPIHEAASTKPLKP